MEWIAIDFETANEKRSSVCAMGIAIVADCKITKKGYWLIRPPELDFSPINISIHGITEDDVKDKPEFDEYWNSEFKSLLEGKTILAHHAGFDISVLRHTLNEYQIPYPSLEYFCTRILAKKIWPMLGSYRLDIVSSHLGIKFKHHYAEDDAMACAEIALKCCNEANTNNLDDFATKFGITKGYLGLDGHKPCHVKSREAKYITPTNDRFNPNHPFYEKTVVFTGTLQSMVRHNAMQKVVDCGGYCADTVNKKANFLVMGNQDFSLFADGQRSNKTKKAQAVLAEGGDIEIISEDEFLMMLDQ